MNCMKKISWCKKQDRGIKLIEPNDNLSEEYFDSSEESLKDFETIPNSLHLSEWLGKRSHGAKRRLFETFRAFDR